MKRLFFALALVLSLSAHAQGVYKAPGEHGPVYSDKPLPGAKEVTLQPLSVVPALPPEAISNAPVAATPRNDTKRAEASPAPYRSFAVLQPQENGSVAANTGFIEVRLGVDPPLQLGEQHAFSIAINGVVLAQRFTTNEFTIPPEVWGGSEQSLQLDASIVDGRGQAVKRAAPVRFFVRYFNVLNAPRRHLPPPKPPRAKPAPAKSEPENFGSATLRR